MSFGTEVLSVEPDFSVVFYDNEGLHREKFGKIIDDRREGTGNHFRFTVKSPGVPSGPFRVVTELGENLYLLEAAVARMGDETLDVGFDNLRNHSEYRPVQADKSFEALGAELDSERPGGALYSCLLHPEKYGDYLCRLLQNPSGVLQGNNAALALGMSGNKACLPRLREMVKNRSCLYYKDCRRTNQFPSVAAICLLGRLGEPEDMDLLMPLVFDEKEYELPLYHTLAPDYIFCETEYVNFVYYQHFTHSVMALVKLGRKYGRSIREVLSKLYAGESGKRLKFRLGNEQYNEAFSKSLEDFFEESLRLSGEG